MKERERKIIKGYSYMHMFQFYAYNLKYLLLCLLVNVSKFINERMICHSESYVGDGLLVLIIDLPLMIATFY